MRDLMNFSRSSAFEEIFAEFRIIPVSYNHQLAING